MTLSSRTRIKARCIILLIDNKFDFRDEVYVRTDPDQRKRIITRIEVWPSGAMMYGASLNETMAWFEDFELSREKKVEWKDADYQ